MPARLPNFLVIGAMKSGTSSLARYLEVHPHVWLAPAKELHFFDNNWDNGVDWYQSCFDAATTETAVGEATPAYMFNRESPARMAATVPDARLVAILRNPVDRAYSHYWHHRSNGKETRPFAEALELEGRRVESGDSREHWYTERGRYLEQFERLLEHYPREQLLVLLFDDLRADPAATLDRVCDFIGVPHAAVENVGDTYNAAGEIRFRRAWLAMYRHRLWRYVPKPLHGPVVRVFHKPLDYPPMDADVRARLSEYFLPHDEALGRWLDRDLVALWH